MRNFDAKCEIIKHYDTLIELNNDPVYDPKPLREHMDKWDGESFIEHMALNMQKSVLEIGVGTGRLALRVAPQCLEFYGIDISPKTIKRAAENLETYSNVRLICNDFMTYDFSEIKFDVIYSSLTFMHIQDKQAAIQKISDLLTVDGLFVLSIDNNPSNKIDMGNYHVTIYPDDPQFICDCCNRLGMEITKQYETEFSHIFIIKK